ncbi:MAG: hypothetical protein ACKOC1_03485 [Hyphomicrobiales bacterium]
MAFFISNSVLGHAVASMSVAVLLSAGTIPAHAQGASDPCASLGKLFSDRGKLIETIQGFQKKKPTAAQACNAFTSLAKLTTATIKATGQDGAWCHVPDNVLPSLESQQEDISKARSEACGVAANERKMQQRAGGSNARQGPLGGAGDILGGPVKLPQGAL